MNILTSCEAQQFLAEKLKDKITVFGGVFAWISSRIPRLILDTEWQHIAMLVEEKMDFNQRCDYAKCMYKLDGFYTPHDDDTTNYHELFKYIHAPYVLRATAMKKAGL